MISVQKTLDHLYRFPKSYLRKIVRFGGYISYKKMKEGRVQMENAAYSLNFVKYYSKDKELLEIPISFITGRKHWFLTAFCIYSLIKTSKCYRYKFLIFNDGTITNSIIEYFKKIPELTIVNEDTLKIDSRLSSECFPRIYKLRKELILMRKLIDVHLYSSQYTVFFDSDMLFYSEPSELISWMKNPIGSFTIKDCTQSYGIPFDLLCSLTSENMPVQLNSGLYGIDSSKINFQKLEFWIKETADSNGLGNYYWEQALTAMHISTTYYTVSNEREYIVKPTIAQIKSKAGTVQHYVDSSQVGYYTFAWKHFLSK